MDAVGQLTGGVAHDFNNLLTIIIGNLDNAKRTIDNWQDGARERLRRAVDMALVGANRAAVLTGHLLAFSRRQPLEPKLLDVNRLLSHLSAFLTPSLGEAVQLEVVGAGGVWPVEADAVQLETAILNLTVNARDAMPQGGRLTIEASNVLLDESYCADNAEVRPGQYVLIAVTDEGVGMREEVATRAFEPFFTTKETGQGTGLGLSQVYGFVKQSGGHVKIYSEPGQGTTVRVYLPRARDDKKRVGEMSGSARHAAVRLRQGNHPGRRRRRRRSRLHLRDAGRIEIHGVAGARRRLGAAGAGAGEQDRSAPDRRDPAGAERP